MRFMIINLTRIHKEIAFTSTGLTLLVDIKQSHAKVNYSLVFACSLVSLLKFYKNGTFSHSFDQF